MKSTAHLRADHDVIFQALNVLAVMNTHIEYGESVDNDDIRSLLTFLREFADGQHHVKEEAILSPALIHAGMPTRESGVSMIRYEHERARTLITAMQSAVDSNRMDSFLTYSRRYVALVLEHIDKEESVLFGEAEKILSDDEDERVAADFANFQTIIVGAQTRERLRHTIEILVAKYLNLTEGVTVPACSEQV